MRRLPGFVLAVGATFFACAHAAPSNAPTQPAKESRNQPMNALDIEETTVADISGWRIGVGNLLSEKRGDKEVPTAQIFLLDDHGVQRPPRIVAPGDDVEVGGTHWVVAQVTLRAGGKRGSIRLQKK